MWIWHKHVKIAFIWFNFIYLWFILFSKCVEAFAYELNMSDSEDILLIWYISVSCLHLTSEICIKLKYRDLFDFGYENESL